MSVGQDEPPTRDELRHLEATVEARFEMVDACLSTLDERFEQIYDRLDAAAQATRSLVGWFDARSRPMADRADSNDSRLDASDDPVKTRFNRQCRHYLSRALLHVIIAAALSSCVAVLVVVR